MPQMKAIRVEEFGEPEVLQTVEVERPSPGEGEVLIEVKAAGINYADTMRRRDQYVESQELPFTPGSEVAGTIAEVGDGVENVSLGDRVITLLGTSGYAEYVVAPARNLIPVPNGMDFDEAAAIPLQGLTAYHVLKTSGELKEGESVVVHAAAGGVGYLAVQMSKLMGASPVIATASTQEKLELARDLGADVLVNYTEEDWPEKVLEATDGNGADVILEMVGGDFPQKNLGCLNVFGRMVVFGAACGDRGGLVPAALMKKNHVVAGFYLPNIMVRRELFGPSLEKILGWISSGDLELNVGARYPLEQARDAHQALEGRETTGKIVLNP
jgi:NADPH2:quinone reductase